VIDKFSWTNFLRNLFENETHPSDRAENSCNNREVHSDTSESSPTEQDDHSQGVHDDLLEPVDFGDIGSGESSVEAGVTWPNKWMSLLGREGLVWETRGAEFGV